MRDSSLFSSLSSTSKEDLDACRKKDAARKEKTVNPTIPESTEMCRDVTPLSHYRSKQSYGKTLKKSLNSLPSSPQKRASVLASLAKRAGLKLECQMENCCKYYFISFFYKNEVKINLVTNKSIVKKV